MEWLLAPAMTAGLAWIVKGGNVDPLLYVVAFLLAGSAMRYLLPYVMLGLVEVGKGGSWPAWEWKYLSAFALAIIGYGMALAMTEGMFARLAEMTPQALMLMAYGSNDVAREAVKFIQKLGFGEE